MIINMDVPVTIKTELGIGFGRVFRLDGQDIVFLRTDRKLDTGEILTMKMELVGVSVPFTAEMKVAKVGSVTEGGRTYQLHIHRTSTAHRKRYNMWLETNAPGGSSTRPDLVVEDEEESFDHRMSHSSAGEVSTMIQNIDNTMGRTSLSQDPYGFSEDDATADLGETETRGLLDALSESVAKGARVRKRPTLPEDSETGDTQDDDWLDDLAVAPDGEVLSNDALAAMLENDGGLVSIEDDWDEDSEFDLEDAPTVETEAPAHLFEDDDSAKLAAPEFRDDRDVPDDFDFAMADTQDMGHLFDESEPTQPLPAVAELVEDSMDAEPGTFAFAEEPEDEDDEADFAFAVEDGDEEEAGFAFAIEDDEEDDDEEDAGFAFALPEEEEDDAGFAFADPEEEEEHGGFAFADPEEEDAPGEAALIGFEEEDDEDFESIGGAVLLDEGTPRIPDEDSIFDDEDSLIDDEGELLDDGAEEGGFAIAGEDDFAAILEPEPTPLPTSTDPRFDMDADGIRVHWSTLDAFRRDFDEQLKRKRLRVASRRTPAPGEQITVFLHLPDQQVLAVKARLGGSDLDGFELKLDLPIVTKGKLKRSAYPD